MLNPFEIRVVAEICHEANRVLCESAADYTQVSWADAPVWQKESAIKGVQFTQENPGSEAFEIHDAWMEEKTAAGWTYGPVKDTRLKTHPSLRPYEELSNEEKQKDRLFKAIVTSFI